MADSSRRNRKPKTAAPTIGAEESGLSIVASAPGELAARPGKDELNLIEYPWTALWKCEDASTVISHEWEVPHPTIPGKMVRALWRVAGDPELGLPNASDLRLYLVLMELTRDIGWQQIVYFTRYDLLRRLRWPDDKNHYDSLRRSFRRLKGVTISAENAFRDGRTRALKDVEFSIIDNVEIVAARPGRKRKSAQDGLNTAAPVEIERDLPLSFFRWNDTIFNSLQHGYLATLDLQFALSLRNDVALSLYRLLSKKAFGGRASFEMELSEFYHRHLGLRPTPFASKMKERLQTGHGELLERGFLRDVRFEAMRSRRGEKVVYRFGGIGGESGILAGPDEAAATSLATAPETPSGGNDAFSDQQGVKGALKRPQRVSQDQQSDALVEKMCLAGVSHAVARLLLETAAPEELRVQLECLADRNPKDGAATFVAAVRGRWQPPGAFLARRESQTRHAESERARNRKAEREHEAAQLKAKREAEERTENEALDARFEMLADGVRQSVEADVAERMKFVVQHIGEAAARAGWQATRRQVLRERLSDGSLEAEPSALEAADEARQKLAMLSKDSELDAYFDSLSEEKRHALDEAVRHKFTQTNMAHLNANHPAWVGVRRNLLREQLRRGRMIE